MRMELLCPFPIPLSCLSEQKIVMVGRLNSKWSSILEIANISKDSETLNL